MMGSIFGVRATKMTWVTEAMASTENIDSWESSPINSGSKVNASPWLQTQCWDTVMMSPRSDWLTIQRRSILRSSFYQQWSSCEHTHTHTESVKLGAHKTTIKLHAQYSTRVCNETRISIPSCVCTLCLRDKHNMILPVSVRRIMHHFTSQTPAMHTHTCTYVV